MATTPTTHATTGRTGWIIATAAVLLAAAVLLIAALTTSTNTPTIVRSQTTTPATANEPDRGTGDPCALRHETRGGFLEGLDPANRCPTPNRKPHTGGRLP